MCGVHYFFLVLFIVPFHFHVTKTALSLWFFDSLHTTDIAKAWMSSFQTSMALAFNACSAYLVCPYSLSCFLASLPDNQNMCSSQGLWCSVIVSVPQISDKHNMSGLFVQLCKAILAPKTNSHMTHSSSNSAPWSQHFNNGTGLCGVKTAVVWQAARDVMCNSVAECTVLKKVISMKTEIVCLITLPGLMYWHRSTNRHISNYLNNLTWQGKTDYIF